MIKKDLLLLLKKSDLPITVSQVLSKIKANKTTIYRELEGFIKEGKVCEVEFGDGKKRYEFVKKEHHHHLICKICGKVQDVHLNEKIFLTGLLEVNFEIESHTLEFFGKCKNCK